MLQCDKNSNNNFPSSIQQSDLKPMPKQTRKPYLLKTSQNIWVSLALIRSQIYKHYLQNINLKPKSRNSLMRKLAKTLMGSVSLCPAYFNSSIMLLCAEKLSMHCGNTSINMHNHQCTQIDFSVMAPQNESNGS